MKSSESLALNFCSNLLPFKLSNKKKTEPEHKDDNHVKASPGKTLDDLFRKTKTVPSIYWMPLNEEEAKLMKEKRDIRDEKRATREAKERRNRELNQMRAEARRSDQLRREPPLFNHQYNGRQRSPPPRRVCTGDPSKLIQSI